MRYFTKELWLRINSCDATVRVQAENEWSENELQYAKEFEEIKKHISRRFIKAFLSHKGFHDYSILGIVIVNEKRKKYSCKMELSNGEETFFLTMSDIKTAKIGIESFDFCILNILSWGYSEFELKPNGNIQLSILCDIENEFQFEFKSIKLSARRD